jgi:hypothetical protein
MRSPQDVSRVHMRSPQHVSRVRVVRSLHLCLIPLVFLYLSYPFGVVNACALKGLAVPAPLVTSVVKRHERHLIWKSCLLDTNSK